MAKRVFDLQRGKPLLDVASYARRGPGDRAALSTSEIALIQRTVGRTPEVVVKVLTRGATDCGAVVRHLSYLGRNGEAEIETDDGLPVQGKDEYRALVKDWDLDLDELRPYEQLGAMRRRAPKLVQKLVFSMPAGTPAEPVLAAVKDFAREEFGLKHRYAMVLHTDEPHPHVHVVVRALSEQGKRLNIRKGTLRTWRREFARHLREHGVEANATDRAVRGESTPRKTDGIHRAMLRGESSHMQDRALQAASDLAADRVEAEASGFRILDTRSEIERGWQAVAELLVQTGQIALGREVAEFARRLPPPQTESQWLARRLANVTINAPRTDRDVRTR